MSTEQPKYAKVPADMSRAGWSRHADHIASAGSLTGRGTSQAKALESLGEALTAMATRAHLAPGFGWDADNRTLWVAVPDAFADGSTEYAVRFDDNGYPHVSGSTTGSIHAARDAFTTSASMERLANPHYRES